jgi:hypothetical protein
MSGFPVVDDTFRASEHLEHARELHRSVPLCDGRKSPLSIYLSLNDEIPYLPKTTTSRGFFMSLNQQAQVELIR